MTIKRVCLLREESRVIDFDSEHATLRVKTQHTHDVYKKGLPIFW